MHKTLLLFVAAFIFHATGFSQNVGIGTTTPQGRLQINHRNSTGPGLVIQDSMPFFAGNIRFKNISNTVGITIGGTAGNNFSVNQFLYIASDSVTMATFRGNGWTGIANEDPQYPLDVSGDINTTGALRVNGDAGNQGQALMSNGNGTMSWGNICDYKNLATFISGSGTWTVPAGVTKIWVELWGAGGGGIIYSGGGGGGYLSAIMDVTPFANISFSIGTGSAGATLSSVSGGSTTVSYAPAGIILTANGGAGVIYTAGTPGITTTATGGGYSATGTNAYYGVRGEAGHPVKNRIVQSSATQFYEISEEGRGGDAANAPGTGAKSSFAVFNTTSLTIIRYQSNEVGFQPGGGGGGGFSFLSGGTFQNGNNGGSGMVIIHY